MQLTPTLEAALVRAATRYHADPARLRQAVEAESVRELARVLGIEPTAAAERMERLQRIMVVQNDWGAGCRLLSDDVEAELCAALDAL